MYLLTLNGKCDRTRYPLVFTPNLKIQSVSYRDQTLPRATKHTDTIFPVPENAQLNPIIDPPDLKPDSEIAAYWFVRACYESFHRPAYYYFPITQTLIVFPPVVNDGDKVLVKLVETADEKSNSG